MRQLTGASSKLPHSSVSHPSLDRVLRLVPDAPGVPGPGLRG